MISLIIGKKGFGKTRILVERANKLSETCNGNIVYIEKGQKLTYGLHYEVRLINAAEYGIAGYDSLYAFLAGIVASDYDLEEIFVDSVIDICGNDFNELGLFLDKIEKLATDNDVKFSFSISAEIDELPQTVTRFAS